MYSERTERTERIDWSVLSRYRTELMGFFAICVILVHNRFQWNGTSTVQILCSFGNVGVDGFLFLSGIGLYFSFSRSRSLVDFYRKRIVRLLIPYFFFAVPFFIWLTKGINISFVRYITQWCFFGYGIKTTWFIPCILFFSLLFPLLYWFQNNTPLTEKCGRRNTATIFILLLFILAILYLSSSHPSFYKRTEIMLTRGGIFILGAHFGKNVMEKDSVPEGTVLFCFIASLLYMFVFRSQVKLPTMWERLSYAPFSIALSFAIAGGLHVLNQRLPKFRFRILHFCGERSLELYLTHSMLIRIYSRYLAFPHFEPTGVVDYLLVIAAAVIISALTHPLFTCLTELCMGHRKKESSQSQ